MLQSPLYRGRSSQLALSRISKLCPGLVGTLNAHGLRSFAVAGGSARDKRLPVLREATDLAQGLKFLKVERTASGLVYIQPNNPPVNALRSEMLGDFEVLGQRLLKAPPRCMVLKCDVAGANIKEMQSQTPAEAEAYANRAKSAFQQLKRAGPIVGFTTKFAIGVRVFVFSCPPFSVHSRHFIRLNVHTLAHPSAPFVWPFIMTSRLH